jgi:hypothetical protein
MQNAPLSSSSVPPPHVLELTARNSAELFDSSAPLCLGNQVVRREIEDYLLKQLATSSRKVPVKLNLYLPPEEAAQAQQVTPALKAYFDSRSAEEQRHLRRIFRDGRIAATIGMSFLVLINGLAEGIRATFERQANLGAVGWVREIRSRRLDGLRAGNEESVREWRADWLCVWGACNARMSFSSGKTGSERLEMTCATAWAPVIVRGVSVSGGRTGCVCGAHVMRACHFADRSEAGSR